VANLLWVCLGGAVGSGARYLLGNVVLALLGSAFPFHTLAVNVAGSFLLGFLMQMGLATDLLSPTLRLTLTTGVLGGFTTYSSFNYETLASFQQNAVALGFLNIAATVLGCLAAGLFGTAAGRLAFGP
jgi:CrcB protein